VITSPDQTATPATGRVAFTAAALAGWEHSHRVPHRVQSIAANALLAALSTDPVQASSKSHSRAVVAAAVGNAPALRLGIDVEWMSPHRPFAAIMRSFAPGISGTLDGDSFYRGWTFLEAYYKAFQQLPEPADIEAIVAAAANPEPQSVGNGAWVLHQTVFAAFKLCLVWKSSDLCDVAYHPRDAMIDTLDGQT
jgi:4'-phosphopantetheinyl transferase